MKKLFIGFLAGSIGLAFVTVPPMLQPSRAQTQNSLAETLQQLQILLKSNQAQAQDPQAEELKQLIY